MNKTILITELAYYIIISVARRCLVETGGVLVGILGDPLVIVAAGQPGDNAVHQAARFTTDPQADLHCLSTWRRIYGCVIEIFGWFHKHHCLEIPSTGDLQQTRQLKDQFKDNRPIIVGILSESGLLKKNLKLRLFGLDQDNNQTEYSWRIIPNDSPEIEKAIQSVPHKPEMKDTQFWNDEDFQFYTNPVGRERICRDTKQLKDFGWQTTICKSKANGTVILEVTNNHRMIRLLMPPEYPLNAPVILNENNKRFFDLKTVREWNSMVTLLDLVTEANQIQNCILCKSRHLIEA